MYVVLPCWGAHGGCVVGQRGVALVWVVMDEVQQWGTWDATARDAST